MLKHLGKLGKCVVVIDFQEPAPQCVHDKSPVVFRGLRLSLANNCEILSGSVFSFVNPLG